ncbi:MAG TPA: hypothetical protein PKW14_05180 [Bacteroidota bacterium]|jgi:hypothetical protein|nr:hypothetical protein [Bacteroidota bacterium]
MKTINKIILGLIIIISSGIIVQKANAQVNVDINFNVFYHALKPYGSWFNYGEYGMCWRPYGVSYSWQPYRDGHWVWTNYGWTWISDYTWGWAPFHYGRWIYDNYYGWIWVPDYEWSPAWVQWRYDDDYIGWAPLPPKIRFTITIGADYNDYGIDYYHWNYVYIKDFVGVKYRYIPRYKIYKIHRHTKNVTNITIINNNYYNYGPKVNDIERVSGTRIREYRVIGEKEAPRNRDAYRISDNNLYIYRPEITRTTGSTRGNTREEINRNNSNNNETQINNRIERQSERETHINQRENNSERGTRENSNNRVFERSNTRPGNENFNTKNETTRNVDKENKIENSRTNRSSDKENNRNSRNEIQRDRSNERNERNRNR